MAVTQTQINTMLQKVGKLYKEALVDFGRETATNNVIALTNDIKSNVAGDFGQDLSQRADAWRRRFASVVSGPEWKQLLDPIWQNFLRDIADNKGNLDPTSNFGTIYQTFIDNNLHLVSRGLTFDITPTETGTGSGNIHRLTVDRNDKTIEGVYSPLSISFTCVTDESTGAEPGEEEFEISAPVGTDILDRGTGVTFDPANSMSSRNSDGSFLSDASFQSVNAADADPADLGAWIDGDGTTTPVYGSAKYALTATNTAMESVEEAANGQAIALEIKGNHGIYQELNDTDLFTPYFFTIRVRPGASLSAGNLTVTWGSKSQIFDLTALSAGSYNIISPTLDKNLWGYQFSTAAPKFKIVIDSLAGDTVEIDNVRFGAMDFHAGTYYFIDADTTQFLAGANEKKFVFVDTVSSDSILQAMIHLAYGQYLPGVADATQITAAGGRTLTFNDNGGSEDTITLSTGDVTSDGYQVGMLLTVAGTSSNNGTYTLTAVAATTLTVATGSFAAEGPLSATATLDSTAAITDPAA